MFTCSTATDPAKFLQLPLSRSGGWAKNSVNKKTVLEAVTMCPARCKMTFDLLTLKVVWCPSHVWRGLPLC